MAGAFFAGAWGGGGAISGEIRIAPITTAGLFNTKPRVAMRSEYAAMPAIVRLSQPGTE